jgi:hypothetical protein
LKPLADASLVKDVVSIMDRDPAQSPACKQK